MGVGSAASKTWRSRRTVAVETPHPCAIPVVSMVLLADSASSTPEIDPQVAPSGSSSWDDVDG